MSQNCLVFFISRYMAICQILKFYLSRKLARSIIFFIWIFAAALMTPWAIFYNQERIDNCESTYYICRQTWPTENLEKSYFLIAIFLMCYVIPLTCITVCYVMIGYRVCHRNAHGVRITHSNAAYEKSKVKVFKMLVLVVILFAFSWAPVIHRQLAPLFRREYKSGIDGISVVDPGPDSGGPVGGVCQQLRQSYCLLLLQQ